MKSVDECVDGKYERGILCITTLDGATRLRLAFNQPRVELKLIQCEKPSTAFNQPSLNVENRCILNTQLQTLGCHITAIHTVHSQAHNVTFPDTRSSITVTPSQRSFTVKVSGVSQSEIQAEFDLQPASWLGLGHLMHHHWPLDTAALVLSPAYPFDNGPTGLSTLCDPTFFSSGGALLSISEDSPCLHVAINSPYPHSSTLLSPHIWTTGLGNLQKDILPHATPVATPRLLTIQSRAEYDHNHVSHPWSSVISTKPAAKRKPSLTFSLSATANVREATLLSLSNLRAKCGPAPCPSPKLDMMERPIWSTWAQYKQDVDQEKVLSFASQIVEHNLPRSVMGIDDRWSSAYGELSFDPLKFPDPSAMVRQLHELGFMVTLWVTPFSNITSSPLLNPETRQYYVKMPDGDIGHFDWWQPGLAAALDVMNPHACEWFVSQLQHLMDKYGIDGFKFDAGEPCFLPTGCAQQRDPDSSPNDYTRAWIRNVASKFPIAEVRSGVRHCQSASPLFRIFDRYSTWDLKNGLASVLTAVLTSGLLGFPFCIPDYVAGNAYGDVVPSAELMIRWTQASVAMPALQFSIPPWHFEDDFCAQAVAEALHWRERFFWPHIKACIDDASEKLWPIVRAMCWEEPDRGVTDIYDQFMVGSSVVVAPVIVQGQRDRAVFLPRGLWRRVDLSTCEPQGEHITGPVWMENVSAGLGDMPVFMSDPSADDHNGIPAL